MADHRELEAYRILLLMVSAIVDDPNKVEIEIARGKGETTFRVRADRRNTALLLGKGGRNSRSIRTLLAGMGMKAGWRYSFVVEGELESLDLHHSQHESTSTEFTDRTEYARSLP